MLSRPDDAGPRDCFIGPPMPSNLVDSVLALLEEAGCPIEVKDRIVKLIEEWEYSREPSESDIQSALDFGSTAEQHLH